jgi:hypothetical protein
MTKQKTVKEQIADMVQESDETWEAVGTYLKSDRSTRDLGFLEDRLAAIWEIQTGIFYREIDSSEEEAVEYDDAM